LHGCCDDIADVTTEEAIFGSNATNGDCLSHCMVTALCTADDIRMPLTSQRSRIIASAELQAVPIPADMLLAIRLYTLSSQRVKFYQALNGPFHGSKRDLHMLRNQLPYVRLLIRSLRALGQATEFHRGVVYRGAELRPGSYLQEVYDNYVAQNPRNGLIVGRILRFPIFTSTSTSRLIAEASFTGHVVYVICLNHDIGVNIADVSYFRHEGEVLLIPPASFMIQNVQMESGTLYIYLESQDSTFSYVR
jgi:hypothetical protein